MIALVATLVGAVVLADGLHARAAAAVAVAIAAVVARQMQSTQSVFACTAQGLFAVAQGLVALSVAASADGLLAHAVVAAACLAQGLRAVAAVYVLRWPAWRDGISGALGVAWVAAALWRAGVGS